MCVCVCVCVSSLFMPALLGDLQILLAHFYIYTFMFS